MSQTTPDSWIERNELDGPEPQCPECEEAADRCGCQPCEVCGCRPASCDCPQCDCCGRAMPNETDDGICVICSIEYLANHQLGRQL
jgi:hypothetical protein